MTRSHRLLAASILAATLVLAGALTLRPGGGGTPGAAYAAARASTGAGDLARFLRFSGAGSVTVKPDTAQITVTATGDGASSKAALNDASDAMEKVIARLGQLGVAKDDMQTSGVWTYRDYEKHRRYHASNSLTVTVHDVAKAGTLLGEATDAGASEVSGPSFSVADRKGAYRAALRQAIEDARAKADAAAASMGVQVSGVVSVSEDGGASSPLVYAAAADSARTSKTVPVEPGKLEIGANVTVTFSYS